MTNHGIFYFIFDIIESNYNAMKREKLLIKGRWAL